MAITANNVQRYGTLLALILAGEIIFSLPFHIPRFFRPTMLDVFGLSNTELGDMFAVYGIVAFLAYFPGGIIADHFSARSLMALSLVATALGGLYLYTLPGQVGLYLVFAYWGLTSILLFWAALIKATRDWGGGETQGLAFGVLDGGRGLVASVFATVALFVFRERLGAAGNTAGLQAVIAFYSVVSLLAAAVIWLALPGRQVTGSSSQRAGRSEWYPLLSEPRVWLQAGIVICAYCGYKALDNYGVYAVQILRMTEVEGAQLNTFASYCRPVAAVGAGLWADRWRTSRLVTLLFVVAAAAFLLLGVVRADVVQVNLILANVIVTFVAVYALRGIYFSLIAESGVDSRVTGSVVGFISVLGFTPDIFFGSITGRILDANVGAAGFQHYFLLMAMISLAGLVCTLALSRLLAGRDAERAG